MCIRDSSCAGTYGHYLLHVDPNRSKIITDKIDQGDLSEKPGWVRMSIHPTMTDEELKTIIEGVSQIVLNIDEWSRDYIYDKTKNEYFHKNSNNTELNKIKSWFTVSKFNIKSCLLYTSDAADERSSVDLGGRRIIKKKTTKHHVST